MPDQKLQLSQKGMSRDAIKKELANSSLDDITSHWSRAFRGPKDVQDIGYEIFNDFMSDNGIFSMRADYMHRIENEVTDMCVSLFHPPQGASGTLTSGGSESIYSAIHAMREWAKDKFPLITSPELIVPYSAHPTFSKGCHYFGLKIVRTALGPDHKASLANMKEAITENTIGMMGSAPCWPYGLYDPIDKISELAQENGLWMHVDACVGGYLAPFAEKLGVELPKWDFSNPGVMSISADLHKLGYCPKSASTILWRSEDLKKYHYVHPSDWPGGEYSMTGFAGSRSAGPIFAAWAVLKYLGHEGYLELTRDLLEKKARLLKGIDAIDGLKAWHNDLLPIAFGSDDIDLSLVKGGLSDMGWILLGCSEPPLINLPLDPAANDDVINKFLDDLRAVTQRVIAGEKLTSEALEY